MSEDVDEAIVVFDRTLRRDLVCWTTMISGFAKSGLPIEALTCIGEWKRREWKKMGL